MDKAKKGRGGGEWRIDKGEESDVETHLERVEDLNCTLCVTYTMRWIRIPFGCSLGYPGVRWLYTVPIFYKNLDTPFSISGNIFCLL